MFWPAKCADNSGGAGIGTAVPRYKLAVNGTIGAKDVIVTNTGWPDTDVSQVPNQTISSGTVCYSNNDTLTAAGVTINGSASVTFVAGHTVHLTPGFRATAGTAGTTFHAWVETAPSAISVSPSSGSGLSQQFTWTVSSPSGYGNIAHVFPLFNTSASGAYGCYIYYSRGANGLFLANDAGTVWTGGFYPGTSSSAANSYCAIFGAGSSVSTSGNQLSLTVNVAFSSPAFSGTKNSYLNVYDNQGLYSGWQQVGTWTVPGTPQYYLTTAASPSGGGTIGPPSGWYNSGAQISVAAAPAAGYTFTGFSGNLAGTALPQILVMNGNKSVTANFTATPSGQYSLTTSVNTAGTGTITPGSGSFSSGQQVQVTAAVNPGYQFTNFTGVDSSNGTVGYVTMNSNRSVTANFAASQYTATTLADLNACIQNPQYTTCTLAPSEQPYAVSTTIEINRSNVTVAGGGSNRTQTKLVRDPSFTGPLIQINAPNYVSPGITLQNFTVCGGLDRIRDINTQSDVNLGTSPVSCPRQQTTPEFTSGRCGDMLHRITYNLEQGQAAPENDFQCTDVEVHRVDTGQYQANPFPSTNDYSLTITNVDFEDSAGHALSLFEDAATGSHVNDVYIHGNAINRSAITGILYGANNAPIYHTRVCDTNSTWLTDAAVFAARNLRIENNTFADNNTGAMGGGPVRWVGLRNNTFTNNYIHPQVGNGAGGTVEFDPCADKFEITGNQFLAPSVYAYNTDGLELYSRNLLIQGNTIAGYPLEGIALNSVSGATVTGNMVQNNDTTQYPHTGGVAVSTAESMTGPCGDPRESRDVTISGNTITGQLYGVYLSEHDSHSTATLRHSVNPFAVALFGSDATDPVGSDNTVVLDSYSGPTASVVLEDPGPRALPVQAVSPITSRCSTGTQPQTFAFPARHRDGGSHIRLIEAVFSISGNDSDGKYGPDAGAGGCHLAYFPQYNLVYLDGPGGGSTWSAGSSVVGAGGSDLSNGYCTIHAGWTPAVMPEPYISPFISHGELVIEFPPSSTSPLRKHIYTVVQDDQLPQGLVSDGGAWKYWGWWATQ